MLPSFILLAFVSLRSSGALRFPTILNQILTEPQLPGEWSYCGEKGDLFTIEVVSYDPDPVKRGRELTVRVKGYLAEDVTGGIVDVLVQYNGIPLIKDKMEICEALKQEPTLPQCPLKKGPWDVTYKGKIPLLIPPGKYSINGSATNQNGKPISCLKGNTFVGIRNPSIHTHDDSKINFHDLEKFTDGQFYFPDPEEDYEYGHDHNASNECVWNRQYFV